MNCLSATYLGRSISFFEGELFESNEIFWSDSNTPESFTSSAKNYKSRYPKLHRTIKNNVAVAVNFTRLFRTVNEQSFFFQAEATLAEDRILNQIFFNLKNQVFHKESICVDQCRFNPTPFAIASPLPNRDALPMTPTPVKPG